MSAGDRGLVWVTGARGFLGRHVARRFADAGWAVAGIGMTGPADAPLADVPLSRFAGETGWVEGEISIDRLDHLRAFAGVPDAVVHAAGAGAVGPSFADPLRDFQLSVASTAILLESLRCHAPQARVVLPSSAAIYGSQPPGPIGEDTMPAPVSPYGTHKLAAEWLCRSAAASFGQPCAVVRYFSLYGPGLKKQLLWDIAQRLVVETGDLRLGGSGAETRDMLHAEDAAALAVLLAARHDGGFLLVNGGTGVASTVRAVAEGLVGNLAPERAVRFSGQSRAGDPNHLEADIGAAKALGFAPRWGLAEGLADYAAWWRSVAAHATTGQP